MRPPAVSGVEAVCAGESVGRLKIWKFRGFYEEGTGVVFADAVDVGVCIAACVYEPSDGVGGTGLAVCELGLQFGADVGTESVDADGVRAAYDCDGRACGLGVSEAEGGGSGGGGKVDMEAVSPVVPGNEDFEVVYAKDQPEYTPLPVLRTEKALLSRWKFTDEERAHVAAGGDMFICVLHFGGTLQPIMPIADTPERAMQIMVEAEG